MILEGLRRVHFIGIGGAGMSAIAKVLIERGYEVSGSDLKGSRAATMLEAMGASVSIGHDAVNVEGAELVVVSSAIPESNPEYRRAIELKISVLARGAALATLTEGFRSLIVSGTHGKTTTTSMIATVLRRAGLDPTYLIGAGLNDVGTNARAGSTDLLVAESDESDGSFLLLKPTIAIVTNIEMDHVDHWSSYEELHDAFESFVASGPADGTVVVPVDEEALVQSSGAGRSIRTGPGGEVWASDTRPHHEGISFTLHVPEGSTEVELKVPGEHNVANAVTAAAACVAIDLGLDEIAAGLGAYRGVERRFQIRGRVNQITVVDDYAHHPTEVRATLAAARPGPWSRVIAVFQPHRYSRTLALARDFGEAFSDADRIVLTDVYGAGEEPVPGVSGKLIADAVTASFPGRPVAYLPHRDDLIRYLVDTARPGDVLLTLGAGDVTTIGDEFLARTAPFE
ncbi:MAG: UDP-N-acetylmuramate--L-alanine ligase [Actinomycetota bacterium]